MRKRLLVLGCALGLGTPSFANAQKPISQTTEYSPYEKETIKRALADLKLEVDPLPENKTIERIDIVRLDVLEDRDPVPDAVFGVPVRGTANALHYTTREWIVRREMLLKEGDPYVQVIVDEMARNMRNRMPFQISLVLIVPVKGSAPDKVGLLVITKDIWSLRLSFDASVTPGGLESLVIVPQETNVAGLHHTAQTRFSYAPETYTFGLGYRIPRFGYTWIGAGASASVTVNRRSGEIEGTGAGIEVGQGLYSTRTEWAWGAEAAYATGIARRYSNARVFLFNSRLTPERDNIPWQYESRSGSASVAVTRSFGWGFKNNFSLSANVSSVKLSTFDYSTLGARSVFLDPVAVQDFVQRAIPIGETRVYPALSWATFRNDYLRTLDISTLALQEDVRLGHSISASIYPVVKGLGSTRDLIGVSGSVGYTVALGDGYASASMSTFAENSEGILTDASVSGGVAVVSPRTGIGRLVTAASFSNRYRNYLNARAFAGGDDRLRGYPSNYFVGKDTVFYNIEFRSRSVRIWTFALGGVVFYDAGDAAVGFDALRAKQSVGAGLRVLIPQVNRPVFRLDFAFPLKRGPFPETGSLERIDPFGFFFSFGQAF